MQLPTGLKGKRNKYLVIDSQSYSDNIHGIIEMTLNGLDFTLDENQYRIIEASPYFNSDFKDAGDIWMLLVINRNKLDISYTIRKWKESAGYKALLRGNTLDEIIEDGEEKLSV